MNSLLSILASLFRWLANRSEPAAVARREAERLESTEQEIAREVVRHDKDAVNVRLRNMLKVATIIMVVTCSGCVSKPYPVYVYRASEVRPLDLCETISLARQKLAETPAGNDRLEKLKAVAKQALEDANAATSTLDSTPSGWFVPDATMVEMLQKLEGKK